MKQTDVLPFNFAQEQCTVVVSLFSVSELYKKVIAFK